ncbi:MAG: HAMP domain-containing sensor histidine kinase [Kofleriaceae bacterium]
MTLVLILDDDPLQGRHIADLVTEFPGLSAQLVTAPARWASSAGTSAAIIGLGFGGTPLADLVATARADDRHRAVLVVVEAADGDARAQAAAEVGPLAVVARPVVPGELLPRLTAAIEQAALRRTVATLQVELAAHQRALASSEGQAAQVTAALASTSTELATATERLVVAEQLAAVGRVVSGIAHELGQQLALVGYAEALKARVAADPELVELADVIVGAQRRLLAMVDAIRDFAGGADGELAREPVDVAAVVADALALLRHDPDVRRRQVTGTTAGHPLGLAHRGKLAQVVINLVHNAALASAPGQAVEVRVAETAAGGSQIIVRDHGVGMPAEVVARLGEPFFTTRGARGSGLGVGICRRIVQDHGGTLTFTSSPGQGTTATIELPPLADREAR